jgi:hypothetical protein
MPLRRVAKASNNVDCSCNMAAATHQPFSDCTGLRSCVLARHSYRLCLLHLLGDCVGVLARHSYRLCLLHLLAGCVGVLPRHSYRHGLLHLLAACVAVSSRHSYRHGLLHLLAYCIAKNSRIYQHTTRTGTESSMRLLEAPYRHGILTNMSLS